MARSREGRRGLLTLAAVGLVSLHGCQTVPGLHYKASDFTSLREHKAVAVSASERPVKAITSYEGRDGGFSIQYCGFGASQCARHAKALATAGMRCLTAAPIRRVQVDGEASEELRALLVAVLDRAARAPGPPSWATRVSLPCLPLTEEWTLAPYKELPAPRLELSAGREAADWLISRPFSYVGTLALLGPMAPILLPIVALGGAYVGASLVAEPKVCEDIALTLSTSLVAPAGHVASVEGAGRSRFCHAEKPAGAVDERGAAAEGEAGKAAPGEQPDLEENRATVLGLAIAEALVDLALRYAIEVRDLTAAPTDAVMRAETAGPSQYMIPARAAKPHFTSEPGPKPASSKEEALIRSIQEGLRRVGYTWVPVDGRVGSWTRAAIRDFQSSSESESRIVDGMPSVHLLADIERAIPKWDAVLQPPRQPADAEQN